MAVSDSPAAVTRSSPVVNARWPPVRTMARTESSPAVARTVPSSRSSIAGSSALWTSGRFMRMTATGPSRETSTVLMHLRLAPGTAPGAGSDRMGSLERAAERLLRVVADAPGNGGQRILGTDEELFGQVH